MTSATMVAPTIPVLHADRLRAWTSTQICYLALRTAAAKYWLQQALVREPRPKDRALVHLFTAAERILEQELRRRALEEQLARGLAAAEDLDPDRVVALD
jgi:hypothetical protein